MEIEKPAMAGTMESCDCQVIVEKGTRGVELTLDSVVMHQYGNQIRKVILDTLKKLQVDNVKISVIDKGALDCTIRARVKGAVYRSVGQKENLPWEEWRDETSR